MSLLVLLAVVVVSALLLFVYPDWRRRWLLALPFPADWLGIVKTRLPFYDKLQPNEQRQLLALIRLFLADKTFYGCGGLQINDDIRLTIAAEACLLLLNRPTDVYPALRAILVYPYGFRAAHDHINADGTFSNAPRALLGESWQQGKVILSWDDVVKGTANFHDGHNVVLHEFSHQLDSESGAANGAPLMPYSSLKLWASVLSREFDALNTAVEHHRSALMDYYGATNPAEFFAVATETFFEKPQQMVKLHPALFAQLSQYYKIDPRQWQ